MYFFATAAASYVGADVTDLRAITSEMSPLPTSQRCFCATAMDSHRSLFSHKLRETGKNFRPTCRTNLNFVNKTKVECQFVQFVTKQGAMTVHSCRAKTSLRRTSRTFKAMCVQIVSRKSCLPCQYLYIVKSAELRSARAQLSTRH